MSHWSYLTPPPSLALPLSLHQTLAPFLPLSLCLSPFSSCSTSFNVPSFHLNLPSSHSHSDVYISRCLPAFPSLAGQQHANYAPQMQIRSYLRRDLQWRRRVRPAQIYPTEVFSICNRGASFVWRLPRRAAEWSIACVHVHYWDSPMHHYSKRFKWRWG